jgi:hypothetical protein
MLTIASLHATVNECPPQLIPVVRRPLSFWADEIDQRPAANVLSLDHSHVSSRAQT